MLQHKICPLMLKGCKFLSFKNFKRAISWLQKFYYDFQINEIVLNKLFLQLCNNSGNDDTGKVEIFKHLDPFYLCAKVEFRGTEGKKKESYGVK